MTATAPLEVYEKLVASGDIARDEHQLGALTHLDALWRALVESGYTPPKVSVEQKAVEDGTPSLGERVGGLARDWGLALGGGSENPSGVCE